MLLNPDQATSNVATAYVPSVVPAAPSEPLVHPGTVLLLNPCAGVFDTVSRSHLDRSRMAARLKSRFARDLGVVALSRFDLPRPKEEGERTPRLG